jgi:hypothetical protein
MTTCLLCPRKAAPGSAVCSACFFSHFPKISAPRICANAISSSLFGAKGGKASAAKLTPKQRAKRASKAGRASAAKLTPAQRKARAGKAARARWAKARVT